MVQINGTLQELLQSLSVLRGHHASRRFELVLRCIVTGILMSNRGSPEIRRAPWGNHTFVDLTGAFTAARRYSLAIDTDPFFVMCVNSPGSRFFLVSGGRRRSLSRSAEASMAVNGMITAQSLGSAEFRAAYGLKYAYVAAGLVRYRLKGTDDAGGGAAHE